MPTEPRNPMEQRPETAEYRRRQAMKARRRKRQRMQRIAVSVVCLLAVLLVIVCIVLIVKAVLDPKEKDKPAAAQQSSSAVSTSQPVADGFGTGGVSWPVANDPSVWNLVLFNSQSPMPDSFTFEEGVVSQNKVGYKFDARIVDELQRMLADCNAVEGHSLRIISGLRGPQTQNSKNQALVDAYTAEGHTAEEATRMAGEVDPPYGQSDHQTGLAVDFITEKVTEPTQAFAETPEYAWLVENAANYGFILRFPESKAAITGIQYQPYHFRYVGAEDAKTITQAGICLEEYLAQLPTSPEVQAVLDGTVAQGDDSSGAGSSAPAADNTAPPAGDSPG